VQPSRTGIFRAENQRGASAILDAEKKSRSRKAISAERSAETRKKLIDAAVDLFLTIGYHGVRIEDITAYAGVGKGTFYLYFESKRDLLLAYLQNVIDLVEAAPERFGGQELDYFARVARRMSSGIDPAGRWTNIDTFLRISANAMDEEAATAARQVHALMVERGNRELMDEMQHGTIRDVDPELVGLTIAGMTEVLSWHLAHGDSNDAATILALMNDIHRHILVRSLDAADGSPQAGTIVQNAERVQELVTATLPPRWPPESVPDTRAKIIRSAVELFLDVGYQNLRVDEITEHAGIGKGTFYHHFSSKQNLLLAYFHHNVEILRTVDVAVADAGLDFLGKVAFRMKSWLEPDTKWNRVVTFIRVMSNFPDAEIAAAAWETYATILEPYKRDFEEGMRQGLVREVDPELAALALAGMQEVLSWRADQDDKYDSATILAFMADVYSRAFLK
jgi:AcrR family transcriptional regulator